MTDLVLHLVSDSTGDTVSAAATAVLTQFDGDVVEQVLHGFIRNAKAVDRVLDAIAKRPGPVVVTVLDETLRAQLADGCARLGLDPPVEMLQPIFAQVAAKLGHQAASPMPGRQHSVDKSYFARIEAIDYAMSYDDGAQGERLLKADVILIGVSRTSKTPTCVYLACRGIKAANIPLVGGPPPAALDDAMAAGVPVVGLTVSPNRLAQIRSHRLETIGGGDAANYADLDHIRAEATNARLLFDRLGVPVLDVTRRSIEETAAEIMAMIRANPRRDAQT